ncbi:MAG: arsenate reductase (glutaredoxin) [Alphaproteobacteria bacterium]|nr:arsenate reductase (glutaredoxin) [Alphaproteobacteria bacterium]|tara:strand:- start:1900 stop:2247 length:348 start_codon:yes stop_codon:yes gene_type:complete
MTIKIYHNPRCSKSRQALTLLEEKGISPEIIEYLNTPLNEGEIKALATLLGVENDPRAMMRVKEDDYKANNLKEADDAALFKAMATFPKLIERPIIVNGKKATIGRPPENALDVI